jgi:hypothetical protein
MEEQGLRASKAQAWNPQPKRHFEEIHSVFRAFWGL